MRRLLYLLPFLLAAYLFTGVAPVRPGEQAVVRRFGRVVAKAGPGLWVGLPWGIDRIDRVAIDRVRRVTVGYQPDVEEAATPGQLLTGDQNLVNVQAVVDYAVDPDAAERYVLYRDQADGLVARAADALLAEWVAGRPVDEVLLTGKAVLPGWLVPRLRERLAPYGLGIDVQAASVAWLLPPDEVKPAFDEVTRAQASIRTREQEALQAAERRLREAEAEQYRLTQLAAAYAHEQRRLAAADADGFTRRLEQYRRLRRTNPDVLTAIWWDETGKLLLRVRDNGRIDLLDNRLGPDGLDLTQFAPQKK